EICDPTTRKEKNMTALKTIRAALAAREPSRRVHEPAQADEMHHPSNAPSTPRAPSPRDMEIFKRVTANCELQKDIAAELHLHPSRIPQILRRVRAYLSASPALTSHSELRIPHSPSPEPRTPSPESPRLLLSTLILKN